jgi:hypothetical protein
MFILKEKGQMFFHIANWVRGDFNIHVIKQVISEKILGVGNVLGQAERAPIRAVSFILHLNVSI